ncbi:hypothetical protein VKT23_012012 [Stygiomarasmius scandens]|uniref:Uncharacterized protein n=1 Tax=Marasmiellus scandens TaxID=2682957 RepID=A0ABR1JC63_9AGAR
MVLEEPHAQCSRPCALLILDTLFSRRCCSLVSFYASFSNTSGFYNTPPQSSPLLPPPPPPPSPTVLDIKWTFELFGGLMDAKSFLVDPYFYLDVAQYQLGRKAGPARCPMQSPCFSLPPSHPIKKRS